MKRIFVFALISVMVLGSMAGCGGSEKNQTNSESGTKDGTAAEAGDFSEVSAQEEELEFQEMTVIDDENCAVRITALTAEEDRYTLTLDTENRSADRTYYFLATEVLVNGVMYDADFQRPGIPYMSLGLASELEPGGEDSAHIYFDMPELEEVGITEITDMQITFQVTDYDEATYESLIVAEETVHIYPYGEEKAAVYEREPQDTDIVLVDVPEAALTAVGYDTQEDTGDFTARLYLENKSEQTLAFRFDNCSLNGYMITPSQYGYGTFFELPAGYNTFIDLKYSGEDLEENGITEAEEVEFSFSLLADDGTETFPNSLAEETYTLEP